MRLQWVLDLGLDVEPDVRLLSVPVRAVQRRQRSKSLGRPDRAQPSIPPNHCTQSVAPCFRSFCLGRQTDRDLLALWSALSSGLLPSHRRNVRLLKRRNTHAIDQRTARSHSAPPACRTRPDALHHAPSRPAGSSSGKVLTGLRRATASAHGGCSRARNLTPRRGSGFSRVPTDPPGSIEGLQT